MVAVLQLGDIVNVMSAASQWATARRFYGYLDGKVPFVAAAGNHDEQDQGPDEPAVHEGPRAVQHLHRQLPRLPAGRAVRRGRLPQQVPPPHRRRREAPGAEPRLRLPDAVLAWAGQVADATPVASRRASSPTTTWAPTTTGAAPRTATDMTLPHNHNPSLNDGVDVWNEVRASHPNVQFVLNGHDIHPVSASGAVGGRTAGQRQRRRAARSTRCSPTTRRTRPAGRGYLRLLTFRPEAGPGRRSPPTRRTPSGYLTDDRNQFTLEGVDLGSWRP